MTVIKTMAFRTWTELLTESARLSALGYICEVKGWEAMRFNKLTVMTED